MVRVPLHVVCCGLLLVLAGTRGAPARCMNETQVGKQWNRFLRRYDFRLERAHTCPQSRHNSSGTCDQAIKDMMKGPPTHEKNQRSVSPWTYLRDQDEERFPPVLSRARCLCEGCIIQGREDRSYNSVPLCADVMVLRRETCPHDPSRYVIRKEVISVPVACICVRPKY